MEFINSILDLPVIVQGALGSFLFWAVYEIMKRLFEFGMDVISRLNHDWRMEYLLSKKSYVLQELIEPDGSENSIALMKLRQASLQVAINRSIHGVIYIVLGLISQPFIGSLSVVSFIVSLVYFYRALRASHIDIESRYTKDWYVESLGKLDQEINGLLEKKEKSKGAAT
ncbi:hypothetical protein ACSFXM_003603 [Vibrio cholerae]|uniref:hypothetical protein n=1 Tax=Vibrio sp. AH4 TaxID=2919577 RepID=UPI0027394437|nr:hypothetical protein [Vibrio sp. AH4]MDP4493984.1 hypothetical protein [Vibrio sp. AH4]